MSQRRLEYAIESWRLKTPFVTSNNTVDEVRVALVEIHSNGAIGRGESTGVYFRAETAESIVAEISGVRDAIEGGATKADLQNLLPAGGARNALDCALWDLEAKSTGVAVAMRIGVTLAPIRTVATIGLAEPQVMAQQARALADFKILKLKLGPREPLACLEAVRRERSSARLIVDVNEGWNIEQLEDFAPVLSSFGVEMIEQPVPRAMDRELRQARCIVPLCADESCCTREDLEHLAGSYSILNIKLDKTGGLTEALALAAEARAAGFELMVGNMIGTSLAMAPASILAPLCRFADLDGALLLELDRQSGMRLNNDMLEPADPELWGGPR